MPGRAKSGGFSVRCGAFALGFLIFLLFFLYQPTKAQAAASLFVEPVSGTFVVGSTFTVSVYINTGGQAINAVEANLKFSPDKLQIVSPTTGRSLIQVWVSQPSYSNADGALRFQGTIPTPGINTDAGLISTVTFRVKSTGTATLRFLDNSRVLLNDGRGTDILGQTTDGIYNLVLPPPAGPVVNSRTHPDQGKWYKTNMAVFEWTPEIEANGYSYILNQDPAGAPDNISDGFNTKISYDNLADGVYYFHIKSLRAGTWGGVTSYVINVDSAPPAEFKINFSPDSRTSNRRPLIDFATTDVTSGIDHYELKIIPLDPPLAHAEQATTPFFIETTSPYSQTFDTGRYEVIARAYDRAGNYFQAQNRLTISQPLFEFIVSDGLRIGGGYVVGWPYLVVILTVILVLLGYFARSAWRWHRIAEERITHGTEKHPEVAEKLNELRRKQKEFGGDKTAALVLFFAIGLGVILGAAPVSAQEGATSNLRLEPPVVTLFPRTVSNDEIVYIGGRAGAPQAKVIIYLQNVETGGTQSYAAVTNKDGEWFYTLPQFLRAGEYLVWTQMELAEEMSPPSAQLDLKVAETALQIGGYRLSFESLYLILLVIFAFISLGLLAWIAYHLHHYRKKNRRLREAIREAEESVRRGFAVLRKDIEDELKIMRKAKLSRELSAEERLREEKLLRDVEEISRHIGREFWEIEHAEE